ncbi:MAG: cell division protein CrgA [Cellulomonas sp.]|nr:cell division protein CrgA [Cellulomonas sp.]
MPKSKAPRERAAYTPPPTSKAKVPNPVWFVPVMVGLMLAGLAWIVLTYLFQAEYPIPGIGQYNLAIGFALLLVGFGMTTRWR